MTSFRSGQSGFTLLELMVVVGILAIIGGAMISAVGSSGSGSVRTTSQIKAAKLEMEQIRQALLRYHADNLQLPKSADRISPADAQFLFMKPAVGVGDWDPDYQTGWRGPYLSGGDSGLVDIGNDLKTNGVGDPLKNDPADPNSHQMVRAIPDPFVITADQVGGTVRRLEVCDSDLHVETTDFYVLSDSCVLDWWPLGLKSSYAKPEKPPGWPAGPVPHQKFGRPYLLFDLDPASSNPRIVSMGPNGRYEGKNTANPCAPPTGSDDLVLCLN